METTTQPVMKNRHTCYGNHNTARYEKQGTPAIETTTQPAMKNRAHLLWKPQHNPP